ncbi:hypothetical protein [Paenibacillus sacheonensis]|uniref:Uncharacterized protein n=1 Tax=Paenibacillus sacheonensis TaxID=742054 RepID=A0A7X4YTZ5_9BACL|nr:hypothetical protein [Paenibacillus sacheonensis]MBM7568857.1 stress-induced morphogen [Paenibacillus sacheonensis]NBC72560.1 hypothetical protein [Paenibacillus sacheonensis]
MSDRTLSEAIRHEADRILNEHGLMAAMAAYGQPVVQGSYALDLMTWRDLDMYLVTEDRSTSWFFELGKAISECLQPSKMSYRNESNGESAHLPKGLYWGTYAKLFGQAWKIDVWAIDSEQYKRKEEAFALLQARLHDGNRPVILALKNELYRHADYRKRFFSVDIYEAVFEGVQSKEQFSVWLERHRGLTYSF